MNFLLSTIALLAGPFVYALGRRNAVAEKALDAIVVLAIAWIIGLHIIPDALAAGGRLVLLFVALGMLFPFILRHIFHLASKTTHLALLVLAAIALTLHAIIDGIALLPANGDDLAIAVILHRLPVGMAIWWTFRPAIGRNAAVIAFALIMIATAVAYFLGGSIVELTANRTLAYFQAFVSGSLIDLVVAGIRQRLARIRRQAAD